LKNKKIYKKREMLALEAKKEERKKKGQRRKRNSIYFTRWD